MEKQGRHSAKTPWRKTYASKDVSPGIRVFAAQMALSLHASGVSTAAFAERAKTTNYSPSRRTLYRHVAAIKGGDSPLSTEKASGAKPKLTMEQREILAGRVLHWEKPTDLLFFQQSAELLFDVKLSKGTASKYATGLQLSFQLVGGRPMRRGLTKSLYNCGYFEWVKARHDDLFFDVPPERLFCSDFFSNSRRLDRKKTLSGIGQKQRKLLFPSYKWTDSFKVGLWGDGMNKTPALLFTYNPDFDPEGARADEIFQICESLAVKRDRIYWERHKK